MIDRLDSCIERLSCEALSAILPICESIALELGDYDSWALLMQQNIVKEQVEEIKTLYMEYLLKTGVEVDEIVKRYKKVIDLHVKARAISKDRIFSQSVSELENQIASTKAHIDNLNLPDGLAQIDLYFENEKYREAKTSYINLLNNLNNYYSQLIALVAWILVNMRCKAVEKGQIGKSDGIQEVRLILNRFHLIVRQLRTRHGKRSTLDIEDEYDVQDLLHALLRLYIDDIRTEEWTPSYAGGCSRMDFLLKKEKLVIEVKKVRNGLGDRELGEQLIIDTEKYKVHPDCGHLICFVYDPEGKLGNPTGIENDLIQKHEGFLEVIVRP